MKVKKHQDKNKNALSELIPTHFVSRIFDGTERCRGILQHIGLHDFWVEIYSDGVFAIFSFLYLKHPYYNSINYNVKISKIHLVNIPQLKILKICSICQFPTPHPTIL